MQAHTGKITRVTRLSDGCCATLFEGDSVMHVWDAAKEAYIGELKVMQACLLDNASALCLLQQAYDTVCSMPVPHIRKMQRRSHKLRGARCLASTASNSGCGPNYRIWRIAVVCRAITRV